MVRDRICPLPWRERGSLFSKVACCTNIFEKSSEQKLIQDMKKCHEESFSVLSGFQSCQLDFEISFPNKDERLKGKMETEKVCKEYQQPAFESYSSLKNMPKYYLICANLIMKYFLLAQPGGLVY